MTDRTTLLASGLATTRTRSRTAPRSWIARLASGGQVAIGARPVVLGADRSCDLVVDEAKVSRRHTELAAVEGGVRVRDLGSTNGTWWQGSRITEVVVPGGAIIELGGAQLRIVSAEAVVLPPSERDRFGAMVGASLAAPARSWRPARSTITRRAPRVRSWSSIAARSPST